MQIYEPGTHPSHTGTELETTVERLLDTAAREATEQHEVDRAHADDWNETANMAEWREWQDSSRVDPEGFTDRVIQADVLVAVERMWFLIDAKNPHHLKDAVVLLQVARDWVRGPGRHREHLPE
jgi:hypothetical protein